MREPRPIPGTQTPLFDRLLDDGINVRQPVSSARAMDLSTLRESVRRDLSRLLNTRSNLRGIARELAAGTVLDYGIPNLAPISPSSDSARMSLARLIEKAITHFEPRLQEVKVIIQQDKKDPQVLLGVVYGNLVFGSIMEPVYFPLALDDSGGKIDLADSQ